MFIYQILKTGCWRIESLYTNKLWANVSAKFYVLFRVYFIKGIHFISHTVCACVCVCVKIHKMIFKFDRNQPKYYLNFSMYFSAFNCERHSVRCFLGFHRISFLRCYAFVFNERLKSREVCLFSLQHFCRPLPVAIENKERLH